jgi:hypothetical protein
MIAEPVNGPGSLEVDVDLWVLLHDCPGKHFLLYNPHTFVGRVAVYCASKNRIANVSKAEISDTSREAGYWLNGFLAGCEPDCPKTDDGDQLPDDDSRVIEWREAIQEFPQTGLWHSGLRPCSNCGVHLLPTTIGEFCNLCGSSDR